MRLTWSLVLALQFARAENSEASRVLNQVEDLPPELREASRARDYRSANLTAGDHAPCFLPTPSLRSPPTSPLSTSSRTPPTLLSGLVHRLDHAPDDHRIG